MSILSLTSMRRSFSTAAGGGARGMDAGIAHRATVQGGITIKTFPLFIERYHQAGRMTIVSIVGEDAHGTTSEYLSSRFIKTGITGKGTGIGRSKTIGVSRR
jgi:hypothetical protein